MFDWEKLHWLNRHYLKAADPERIAELAWPHFVITGFLPATEAASPAINAWFSHLLALLLPAVNQLDELPAKAGVVFHFDPAAARSNEENAAILATESTQKVLAAFAGRVRVMPETLRPGNSKPG